MVVSCYIYIYIYESSCSHDFLHCASLHHSSFDEMIFTLVPPIFFKGVVRNSRANPCNAHVTYIRTAHMYATIRAQRDILTVRYTPAFIVCHTSYY